MKKSTLLYALLFYFLFIGWAITPAQAHIGEPCPHKNLTHQHCDGSGGESVRTLEDLNCTADQIPKFDGAQWVCAADVDTDTNTNAATICIGGKVLNGNGECVDFDALQAQINALQAQIDALDGGVVVLDALGVEVGRVIDVTNDTVKIPLRMNGHTFTLFADKEGFFRNDQFPLFESSDCSGTPLMARPTPSLFSTVTVGSPGHTVYLPDPDASFQNILIKSVLKPNGCDLQLPIRTFLVVPAIPLVDLDTLFTPPFDFELQ